MACPLGWVAVTKAMTNKVELVQLRHIERLTTWEHEGHTYTVVTFSSGSTVAFKEPITHFLVGATDQ